jgi:uncharacterized MAPEG superfamily protein
MLGFATMFFVFMSAALMFCATGLSFQTAKILAAVFLVLAAVSGISDWIGGDFPQILP